MNEPAFAAGADAPSIVTPMRRRSRWPGRLLVLMAIGLALVAALALIFNMIHLSTPVHVVVDGQEVYSGFDFAGMPPAHKVVLAGALLVAMLAALLIVPVALLLALAVLMSVVLLVVGLPLAVVALGLLLLLSPLILVGWLLWKLIAS